MLPKVRSLVRTTAVLLALTCGGSVVWAEPADPIDVDAMRQQTDRCFGKLADVLDHAGYSYRLTYDPDLSAASVVDATAALRDESGVEVVLLTDGRRMHVVAPFLSHPRARALVRYAEGQTDRPWRRVCVFARAVQEDAGLRAWQRAILLGIAAACALAFAGGLVVLRRRPDADAPQGP